VPPMRIDGLKFDKSTPGNYLRAPLKTLQLEQDGLAWYAVVMTERYAHLRPELFTTADLATIQIELDSKSPKPVHLRGGWMD